MPRFSYFSGMFEISLSKLENLAVHVVGNKGKDEELRLSSSESGLDRPTMNIIWHYLQSAFRDPNFYQFQHPSGLEFNSVYQVCKGLFQKPEGFLESSQKLAQLLYDVSDHPQVRSGELLLIYFPNLRYGNIEAPALALFKSEKKQPFLFTEEEEQNIELYSYQGINPSKVDKAALVFAQDEEEGYQVLAVDNINKGEEAKFWFEQFLKVQIRSTEFTKTTELIKVTKSFIDQDLGEDQPLDKTESIELMGRSKEYFSVEEEFNPDAYSKQVFEDEAVADRFREYVRSRDLQNLELDEGFGISEEALKKKNRVFKSVIKLDRNFHIYVHGDRSKIEKGTEEDGRKYYKVYFDEES